MYQREYYSGLKYYYVGKYYGNITSFYNMILEKRTLINDVIKNILIDRCSATLEELGIAVSHSENFLYEMRCFTDSRKFPNKPIIGVKETVELQITLSMMGFLKFSLVPDDNDTTVFEVYGNPKDIEKIINVFDNIQESIVEYNNPQIPDILSLKIGMAEEIKTLLDEISAEDILNNMISPKESVEYFYNKYPHLVKSESTLAKYEKLLKSFH